MEISAKIVADSISNGIRLTTMELCYPRFIHAEAKTHRVFSLDDNQYELVLKQSVDFMDDSMLSRNASSSRAIPIEKMLEQVEETPAMPIHWGKNQPGMQARKELEEPQLNYVKMEWQKASEQAISRARWMRSFGAHKQLVNRVLEPFQWIRVIVTATEWYNFFKLRHHEDAQPEIALLASKMREAMNGSEPQQLSIGKWHLPYITMDEIQANDHSKETMYNMLKCSVARCARVSYLNHDNSTPNIDKDLLLAEKLLEAGHMSPFEHQATPMKITSSGVPTVAWDWEKGITHMDKKYNFWSGNFRGFLQYRQLLS